MSTDDLQNAAEAHVRQQLRLGPDAKLSARVFVGNRVKDETVMCGTVRGTRGDGEGIEPQRFIAATHPLKWLLFQPVTEPSVDAVPEKFVDWRTGCGRNAGG